VSTDAAAQKRKRRGSGDGSMSLREHLRELRNRSIKSAITIVLAAVFTWVYYDKIFALLRKPFDSLYGHGTAAGHDYQLTLSGITDAFALKLQIVFVTAAVIAAPIWLYQFWRFVTPGLHKHERRWALGFAAAAVPLFFGGIAMGYLVLPNAMRLLIGFTPNHVANFVNTTTYLTFVIKFLLVFGAGFVLPAIVVLLNLAGVLPARVIGRQWRLIVFGIFVFAAVAAPTPDPWTMLLLALPLCGLFVIAWGIATLSDRRKRKRNPEGDYGQWTDEETSPLPKAEFDPADDIPSDLTPGD
jgi:sec-independent protein translocase protein TatC